MAKPALPSSNDVPRLEVPQPFYVGYLPLPDPIRRFLVPWLLANLVLLVAVGVVLAQQQRDPGDGVWDTGMPVTYEGVLTLDPYPVLRIEHAAETDGPLTVLPIEMAKLGARERLAPFDGQRVRLTGFAIRRTGRVVLGLESGPGAIEPLGRSEVGAVFSPIDLGTHTLVGEIVDPQCFMGAMKPGEGKPHKVCATLCITGGIPPVFMVRDEGGNTTTYLLTTSAGEALPPTHYPYIADPIRLTGRVERRGDLLVLRADLSSFQRLD
ncbi:MAG: hypothetical protein ACIAXF_08245 [Phycisphaerales bacterium JB063]